MENVTLFSADFSKLHNTLCELRTFHRNLKKLPETLDTLERIIKSFDESLENAYAQDDEITDRKMDHYASIQERYGLNAVWSIFEVESLLEKHPFSQAKTVSYFSENHWGEKDLHIEIQGNTWLSLFAAADEAICKSGDMHHVFIELLEPKGETLVLRTGS